MTKTALVPVADGTEEIEAVSIIDVLRRAGIDVTVASVMGRRQVTASRGVVLTADALIAACAGRTASTPGVPAYDLVALPGGMPGARRLAESADLGWILDHHAAAGRLVGAICAAPAVVLHPRGLLHGRRATCHPDFKDRLPGYQEPRPDQTGGRRVVADGHFVTSQGPGTAIEFALFLVALLLGEEKAAAVAGPLMIRSHRTGGDREVNA